MNPQHINLLLWSTTAAVAAAGAIVAVVEVASPLEASVAPPSLVAAPTREGPTRATTQDVPSLDSFGAALTRTFRPPLDRAAAESPGKAAAADSPVAVPATLRLVGSVGDSIAMIQGPDGTVALVEVGDDVDGADVIAIGPTRVELRQNGRRIVLEKPPTPDVSGVTIR